LLEVHHSAKKFSFEGIEESKLSGGIHRRYEFVENDEVNSEQDVIADISDAKRVLNDSSIF
jgi:hypothetical protein